MLCNRLFVITHSDGRSSILPVSTPFTSLLAQFFESSIAVSADDYFDCDASNSTLSRGSALFTYRVRKTHPALCSSVMTFLCHVIPLLILDVICFGRKRAIPLRQKCSDKRNSTSCVAKKLKNTINKSDQSNPLHHFLY